MSIVALWATCFLHLSFFERMLILSFTENGEVPLIFLVMTLFDECIQLEFSPNFIRDSHLGFSVLCSRMSFCTVVLI